ncbi:MAG: AbrB/MazE/SpoVT family DNA-binding domain-containing protein [Opitutaceae bacterium]
MIKKLSKIGNSRGIIFDAALMEQAHLKEGDEVNVTVHEGGSITLTPIRRKVTTEEVLEIAEKFMDENEGLFHRLS